MSPMEQQKIIGIAAEMIKRGARVPVVEAMLPIKHQLADSLYRELTGEASKTGPLPSNHLWYISTLYPMRIVQSSLFIGYFKAVKLRSSNSMEAEILNAAYDLYLDHCVAIGAEPLITFCRAWHLLRELRIKNLTMAKCTCCSGEFVFDNARLRAQYQCPLCNRSSSLSAGRYRRRDAEISSAVAA